MNRLILLNSEDQSPLSTIFSSLVARNKRLLFSKTCSFGLVVLGTIALLRSEFLRIVGCIIRRFTETSYSSVYNDVVGSLRKE